MKTITIKEDTWKGLWYLKLQLSQETLDETIKYLLYELTKEEEKNETD